MIDKTKPVSIRLARSEINQLQARAYTLSASVTGVARDLIRTGLAGGDNKALADRLMLIGRRIVALEQQSEETHARVQSIDQAARADDTETHAGARSIAPFENRPEIDDPRSFVADPNQHHLRCGLPFDHKLDLAATGVGVGVARELGYRRRQTSLVLGVEAERAGDLPGPLARRNHIRLVLNAMEHSSARGCARV